MACTDIDRMFLELQPGGFDPTDPGNVAKIGVIRASLANEENAFWCCMANNQCVRWNVAAPDGTYHVPEKVDWHCHPAYQGCLEGSTREEFMKVAENASLWKRKSVNQDGYCYLCDKLVYMVKDSLKTHLNSNDHMRKIPFEVERRGILCKEKNQSGTNSKVMPEPECPWLMYLPWEGDMKYPQMKCLICDKWVKDDDGHRKGGPKDHLRILKLKKMNEMIRNNN